MKAVRPLLPLLPLLVVLVPAAAAPPTGRLRLEPALPAYVTGQDVRLIIELDLVDTELGGNLNLGGLPDASWARYGTFNELVGETFSSDGRLITRKRFSTVLRLLREGRHEIAPVLGGVTAERQRRGFMSVISHTPFRLELPPLPLRVDPLPSPAPDDFHGGIGQFRLSATLTPATAAPGDLVNLRWTLDGFGNLDFTRLPAGPTNADFRAYPPREEDRDPGRRLVVSQVLIPQNLSATPVPTLAFSVFDPVQGRYLRLSAGPFPLELRPRPEGARPSAEPDWTPTPSSPEPAASPERLAFEFTGAPIAQPLLALFGGLAVALFVFSALLRRSRPAAILLSCAVVAAAVGLRRILERQRRSAEVELAAETPARLCPSATSRELVRMPQGARVHIAERTDRWLRVEFDGASGWIPADAVAPTDHQPPG